MVDVVDGVVGTVVVDVGGQSVVDVELVDDVVVDEPPVGHGSVVVDVVLDGVDVVLDDGVELVDVVLDDGVAGAVDAGAGAT